MQKLLILSSILNIFMFCSCKPIGSDTATLVENDGTNIYAFAFATGKDGTEVLCRLKCIDEPTPETLEKLCLSRRYIKKSLLEGSKIFSDFLDEIGSRSVTVKQIQSDSTETVNFFFETHEQNETYDPAIGTPSEVCRSYKKSKSSYAIRRQTSPGTINISDEIVQKHRDTMIKALTEGIASFNQLKKGIDTSSKEGQMIQNMINEKQKELDWYKNASIQELKSKL